MQKPLLTFLIAGFQHERFVREAVESAFAQTYSPLEIILSDDCSQDGTFELMRQAAAAYRGPHHIVLNRNPIRRSLGGHLNQLMGMSTGEFIVIAAADDVSAPERTSAIYEAWNCGGRKATSIHSAYVQIDENGREIANAFPERAKHQSDVPPSPSDFVRTLRPTVFGCTHAFSKKLFDVFGNVPEDLIHEDDVLGLRSLLAGSITFIDRPLVRYRIHGNNVYAAQKQCDTRENLSQLAAQEAKDRRNIHNRKIMYVAFLSDLVKAQRLSLIADEEFKAASLEALQRRRYFQWIEEYLESGFVSKLRKLNHLRHERLEPGDYRILLVRLLPVQSRLRVRLALNYVARMRRYAMSALRLLGQLRIGARPLREQENWGGVPRVFVGRFARSK